MQAAFILSLLCGLLATATALNCVQCIESFQEPCTGKTPSACRENTDTCTTFLGQSSLGVLNHTGIMKDCIESASCNAGTFSVTVGSAFTLRSVVECCKQEGCNSNTPVLPPANTTLNGLQCPVCYSKESAECEGKETMRCAGAEDHCISMTGILINIPVQTPLAVRGCATKSTCDLKMGNIVSSGFYVYVVERMTACTKAANSAHQIPGTGSLACLLPSLLLLKYFS